ncbi:hypothetical protein A1O1_09232 [Capronia coronata CBS 617.96]|uniref:Alpha and gamma adaptin binding protein p34 n=1 Tax=Capronia coronata CBS 617.96 TaxID=1182541 RepID=W9XNE2_9EURO|nr:uncharacterized protein A1O1_09232 [Capronia coronata CBS 617.96]EXJ78830.1 hypothetical protein A1O1_09232 [Capronia coronata CBS 617.96]
MAASTSTQLSSLRLLVLAPASEPTVVPPFPNLLEAITGSRPPDEVTSFTGYTSHPPLALRTKYYSSDVGIWCDELPAVAASRSPGNDQKASSSTDVASTATPTVDIAEVQLTKRPDEVGSPRADHEPDAPSTLEEWKQQMLSPEASEVRAVIGGIVLVLPTSSHSSSSIPTSYYSFIEAVHALREAIEEETYGRDVASIVVLQSTSPTIFPSRLASAIEEIEDACLSDRGILGWDFVAWDGAVQRLGEPEAESENQADARNDYGEETGIKRIIEVLEGIDWSVAPDFGDFEDGDGFDFNLQGDDDEQSSTDSLVNRGLSDLDHELQREMMELKMSMFDTEMAEMAEDSEPATQDVPGWDSSHAVEPQGEMTEVDMSEPDKASQDTREAKPEAKGGSFDDEEFQVEELQGLMERVVAIREAGSEMPKAERERFARREIARIMREIG